MATYRLGSNAGIYSPGERKPGIAALIKTTQPWVKQEAAK